MNKNPHSANQEIAKVQHLDKSVLIALVYLSKIVERNYIMIYIYMIFTGFNGIIYRSLVHFLN